MASVTAIRSRYHTPHTREHRDRSPTPLSPSLSLSSSSQPSSILSSPPRTRSRSASPYKRNISDVGIKLWVGNIHPKTREEHIELAFHQFGEIIDIYVPSKGRARGGGKIAFVTFAQATDAERAVEEMDDREMDGWVIQVKKGGTKNKIDTMDDDYDGHEYGSPLTPSQVSSPTGSTHANCSPSLPLSPSSSCSLPPLSLPSPAVTITPCNSPSSSSSSSSSSPSPSPSSNEHATHERAPSPRQIASSVTMTRRE